MFAYIEAFSSAFMQWQFHCVTGIFHHSHLYERNCNNFASLQLFNVCTKAEFTILLLILLFLLNINLSFCSKDSDPACRQHTGWHKKCSLASFLSCFYRGNKSDVQVVIRAGRIAK